MAQFVHCGGPLHEISRVKASYVRPVMQTRRVMHARPVVQGRVMHARPVNRA